MKLTNEGPAQSPNQATGVHSSNRAVLMFLRLVCFVSQGSFSLSPRITLTHHGLKSKSYICSGDLNSFQNFVRHTLHQRQYIGTFTRVKNNTKAPARSWTYKLLCHLGNRGSILGITLSRLKSPQCYNTHWNCPSGPARTFTSLHRLVSLAWTRSICAAIAGSTGNLMKIRRERSFIL